MSEHPEQNTQHCPRCGTMKPEAQRIAIAEACGWVRMPSPAEQQWGEAARDNKWWYVHQLPDYLNDLNAMHEAEKVLQTDDCHSGDSSSMTVYESQIGKRSTAAQRAEAFLRTIGKYETKEGA